MKKNLFIIPCSVVALAATGYAGYELGKSNNTTESLIQNITEPKKIAYADKINDTVVTEIFEDGYTTLHGDHTHFEKGLVPFNAKFLDKLIYKNANYVLKNEDIQYEVAQGYIIKIDGKFYYYPKDGVKQSNVVDEETAKAISSSSHHHHSSSSEDTYTFNPKDVVSETADGYIVRHGDHYHYIKKSDLSANQIAAIKQNGINNNIENSTAGIDHATSDGYIFNASDIIGKNSFGFIVRHGSHDHIIPFNSLRGTKWEYLLNDSTPLPKYTPTAPTHNDDYKFDKKDIVAEDEDGYTVRHGDHYHYIPKEKKNQSNNNNENNKQKNNDSTESQESYSKNIEDKRAYLAKILNLDKNVIKVTTTDKGIAFIYPHGDHYHTLFESDIHIGDDSNLLNDEVEKQIAYIADIYGVPYEAIRVTKDFFIFNEPTQEYDPTHIHPYLIPRDKFRIPKVTGDKEVDFQDELLALAERTGIDPDTIRVEGDKFVIPHGSHNHYVKIKSGGAQIYEKNKIPNIIGSYISGDFDKEVVLEKINSLIAANTQLTKDSKQAGRILRALNQLKTSITTLPTNSTAGYLAMLDAFDKKYINIDSSSVEKDDEEFVKVYNSLLTRVKNSNIEHLGLEKETLINELNLASNSHNKDTFERVTHLLDEVEKFDTQTGPTILSYIKYFLENINSTKIDNELREELAYLIKYSYLGEAQIIDSHAEELIVRLINAKNKLHYQLSTNRNNEVTYGENYNRLNEKYSSSDTYSILEGAKNFVDELDGFLPTVEFSKTTNKDELVSNFNAEKNRHIEETDSSTSDEEEFEEDAEDSELSEEPATNSENSSENKENISTSEVALESTSEVDSENMVSSDNQIRHSNSQVDSDNEVNNLNNEEASRNEVNTSTSKVDSKSEVAPKK